MLGAFARVATKCIQGAPRSRLSRVTPAGEGSGVLRRVVAPSWLAIRGGVGLLVLLLALGTPRALAATAWTVERVADPTPAVDTALYGISCLSTTACIAVGHSGRGALVERWDGRAWSIMRAAPGRSKHAYLWAVSCTSKPRCIAVGEDRGWPLVERWDGSRWSLQPTPHAPSTKGLELDGVSCLSRSCMAVGTNYGSTRVAERWNAKSWSLEPLARPPRQAGAAVGLDGGVSCVRGGVCVAVGSYGNSCVRPLIERWNGKRWSMQRSSNPSGSCHDYLLGISCVSRAMCLAVGGQAVVPNNGDNVPVAQRWNGRAWKEADPHGQAFRDNIDGLDGGVSCRLDSCTAAGDVIAQWNGSSWSALPTNPGPLWDQSTQTDISCATTHACFASGLAYKNPDGSGAVVPVIAQGP
jgi:hypothetical protein